MAKKKIHTNADERSLAAGRNIAKDSEDIDIEGKKNVCIVGDGNFVIKNLHLVVLDSELFNGMEFRPHILRRLSENLVALAEKANRLPMGGKHRRPTKVEICGTASPRITQPHYTREPVNYRLPKNFGRQKVNYTTKPRGKHEDD